MIMIIRKRRKKIHVCLTSFVCILTESNQKQFTVRKAAFGWLLFVSYGRGLVCLALASFRIGGVNGKVGRAIKQRESAKT